MFLLKRLCPRTLFSRTSPYSISTALCSTSSPSHLTYSHPDSGNWCDDSFWRDMQTIMNTDIGSFIIAESNTRENMAYFLQEYGPSVLRSVTKSDVLLMVDRLILEKKLVVETVELIKPFKRPEEVEKAYAHDRELENQEEIMKAKN